MFSLIMYYMSMNFWFWCSHCLRNWHSKPVRGEDRWIPKTYSAYKFLLKHKDNIEFNNLEMEIYNTESLPGLSLIVSNITLAVTWINLWTWMAQLRTELEWTFFSDPLWSYLQKYFYVIVFKQYFMYSSYFLSILSTSVRFSFFLSSHPW